MQKLGEIKSEQTNPAKDSQLKPSIWQNFRCNHLLRESVWITELQENFPPQNLEIQASMRSLHHPPRKSKVERIDANILYLFKYYCVHLIFFFIKIMLRFQKGRSDSFGALLMLTNKKKQIKETNLIGDGNEQNDSGEKSIHLSREELINIVLRQKNLKEGEAEEGVVPETPHDDERLETTGAGLNPSGEENNEERLETTTGPGRLINPGGEEDVMSSSSDEDKEDKKDSKIGRYNMINCFKYLFSWKIFTFKTC